MVTGGIDLAASPERTAFCRIEWSNGTARIIEAKAGGDDPALLHCIESADKVGIDVPFGWPEEFVTALVAYQAGHAWPERNLRRLQLRDTDRFVYQHTKRYPLSVSSDRIAVPAMRAAWLFGRLAKQRMPVNRDGSGRLVEVYPAAALRMWGLTATEYKRVKGQKVRQHLIAAIIDRTRRWLEIDDKLRAACEENDDVLDALLAALIARAAACGLCEPIPQESASRATKEGWIALPRPGSLDVLARAVPPSEIASVDLC